MDTAKILRNGHRQSTRLPKAYWFSGKRVYLKRMGKAVVLLPEDDSWQPLIESLAMFSADFLAERNQPPAQRREG